MGGTKQVDKSLNAVTPKGILGVAFIFYQKVLVTQASFKSSERNTDSSLRLYNNEIFTCQRY